jgi:hypothetical protein
MTRWCGHVVLSGLVVLGASAPAARAQLIPPRAIQPPVNPAFTVAPGLQIFNNAFNAAVLGQTIRQFPPWAFGYNSYPSLVMGSGSYLNGYPAPSTYPGAVAGYGLSATMTTNPYGDYGAMTASSGYSGNSGYMQPSYGILSGSSDAIRAQGDYYKSVAQARLMQVQVDQGVLDTRRKLLDEARYERGLLSTTEELRQQELAQALARARHEPPITDITSGRSLNDLLHHLECDPTVTKGPHVPIDEEVLKHINVTSPNRDGASVGLLKDDGKLQWPAALSGKEFEGPRADLSRRLADVVQDLKLSKPVQPGAIKDLNADVARLRSLVEKSAMSPTDYIVAQGYIDQVRATVLALNDPNVVSIFNHKFSARNVAELVDGMMGLDFAPAAPGDEWAYRELQQALVVYDHGASPQNEPSTQPEKPHAPPPPASPPPVYYK